MCARIKERAVSSLIYTYTGLSVDPLALREGDVVIYDIARALSMICRYNGHVRRFYSVAEHSLLVAAEACYAREADNDLLLQALLHDASEAYLCDLVTPIKDRLAGYREAEVAVQQTIYRAFGLLPDMLPVIKSIDTRLRIDEMLALQRRNPDVNGKLWGLPQTGQHIQCLTPPEAEQAFLKQFEELMVLRSFHS